MGLERYTKSPIGDKHVYMYDIDEVFVNKYGFEYSYEDEYVLERVFRLDNGDYLRVSMYKDRIYFYEEYNCGGKIWDKTVELERDKIYVGYLEDIINTYLD